MVYKNKKYRYALILLLGISAISVWTLHSKLQKKSTTSFKVENELPKHAKPWAGTVSHHLLAHDYINNWFSVLKQHRRVETFFILSPSHWGINSQDFSLSLEDFETEKGTVVSHKKYVQEIQKKLNVAYESQVFTFEHGVLSLLPYIKYYFPKAKIVAIAYQGEPPLNQPHAQKLKEALEDYFDVKGKSKNFLLISTDFAHHGDIEGTNVKDDRSRLFFSNPSTDTWIFAGCDNRPGIYTLAYLLRPQTKACILNHTNSYEISGQDAHDITSYFFSFFYDD